MIFKMLRLTISKKIKELDFSSSVFNDGCLEDICTTFKLDGLKKLKLEFTDITEGGFEKYFLNE